MAAEPAGKSAAGVRAKVLAELFGVTERRIQQLASDGTIPRPDRGRYELAGSIRAYTAFLRRAAQGQGTTDDQLREERRHLLRVRREQAELTLDRDRGEVLYAADVEARWVHLVRTARSGILAVPSRVRARLQLTAAQADVVEDELRSALAALSAGSIADGDEPST